MIQQKTAQDIARLFFDDHNPKQRDLEIMMLRWLEDICTHKDQRIADLKAQVEIAIEAFKDRDIVEPDCDCERCSLLNYALRRIEKLNHK